MTGRPMTTNSNQSYLRPTMNLTPTLRMKMMNKIQKRRWEKSKSKRNHPSKWIPLKNYSTPENPPKSPPNSQIKNQ